MLKTKTHLLANEAARFDALKKFGYSDKEYDSKDVAIEEEWCLLAQGIYPSSGYIHSPIDSMQTWIKDLVIERVRQRRELDELMRKCDAAHEGIFKSGPHPALVEAYTEARDRFENAVENFITSGEELILTKSGAYSRVGVGSSERL
jgi:hypothetical protein